jgi:hypothetical protein
LLCSSGDLVDRRQASLGSGAVKDWLDCVVAAQVRMAVQAVGQGNGSVVHAVWRQDDMHFDNVLSAAAALIQISTFDGWLGVMNRGIDVTDVGITAKPMANTPTALFFVSFIMCGSFFALNLFIGVVIDEFESFKVAPPKSVYIALFSTL